MDVLFHVNSLEEEIETKINLDELYDRKQQRDLNTLDSYNKILNRIHNRIKTVSRNQINEQFCWYIVPEMMIGIPKFDHGACVAYLMDKLRDNGFIIRYTHPNLLFISWQHWVPGYVRNEIKKKTGKVVDGYGKEIRKDGDNTNNSIREPEDINSILLNGRGANNSNNANNANNANNTKKDFKDINSYKPSGKFIYNDDLFKKLENRFN
jgi:hypothetical protein